MSFAIFVDAGYLFNQGAQAVLGSVDLTRSQVVLDGHRFTKEFATWIGERYPNDQFLRTYWYDGARRGIPTPDHLDIAAIPFVKLRLGRLNAARRQKSVDTLIVRDLMILSQERSILRAVVLSGDEDLREGIVYAQERGVQVAIVGIEADGHRSQSLELVREADEHLTLPVAILECTLARRRSGNAVAGRGDLGSVPSSVVRADVALCVECAKQFAREWLERAKPDQRAALVAIGGTRIPHDLDVVMLQRAVQASGIQAIPDEVRHEMREAFWLAVEAETGTRAP